MPTHAEKKIIPYTAQQMFDLVLDIEKYPEFLPWCADAKIKAREETHLIADLTIGYKIFSETFTSRVQYQSPRRIDVLYEKGPFQSLANHWTFVDMPHNQCEVDFFIDFSFEMGWAQQAMEFFFNEAVAIMVRSFENRAHQLYREAKAS